MSSIDEVERRLNARLDALEKTVTLLKDQTEGLASAARHLTASAREAIAGADALRTAQAAASTRAEYAESALAKAQRHCEQLDSEVHQLRVQNELMARRLAELEP